MCEYAEAYGGFPPSDMAWPLFLAALRRISRFGARAELRLFDAVTAGIGAAFGEGGEIHRNTLVVGAFPLKDPDNYGLIPNLAQQATE